MRCRKKLKMLNCIVLKIRNYWYTYLTPSSFIFLLFPKEKVIARVFPFCLKQLNAVFPYRNTEARASGGKYLTKKLFWSNLKKKSFVQYIQIFSVFERKMKIQGRHPTSMWLEQGAAKIVMPQATGLQLKAKS